MPRKRHRIAIYTRTYPPRSGGIASAHANLYHLLAQDHDVRLFAFDDDTPTPDPAVVRRTSPHWITAILTRLVQIYVRRFDKSGPPAHYCPQILSVLPAIYSLNRAVRKFRPDIVILPDNFVPGLAFRRPPNARIIWISHNNYKRFENQPLVHQRSWADLHFAHRLELRALRRADHVICPSDYMKRVFAESFPINTPLSVIPNFVHPKTLARVTPSDLREDMGLRIDQKLIYIPSAGSPVKGSRYVYEIVRRLGAGGKAAFFLSGTIPEDLRIELNSLCNRIPIHAPGNLTYEANLANVAACDFAVSPTLIENLSCAILEGLMLGVPFVTFDVGGNREIVHHGVNGFVVPKSDVEGLIRFALELGTDGEILKRFRESSLYSLSGFTDPSQIKAQFESLFDRLLAVRDDH